MSHESIKPLYTKIPHSPSNEKVIEHCFPSIACNRIIQLHNQRQLHNKLATMWRAKLKEAHQRFKSL